MFSQESTVKIKEIGTNTSKSFIEDELKRRTSELEEENAKNIQGKIDSFQERDRTYYRVTLTYEKNEDDFLKPRGWKTYLIEYFNLIRKEGIYFEQDKFNKFLEKRWSEDGKKRELEQKNQKEEMIAYKNKFSDSSLPTETLEKERDDLISLLDKILLSIVENWGGFNTSKAKEGVYGQLNHTYSMTILNLAFLKEKLKFLMSQLVLRYNEEKLIVFKDSYESLIEDLEKANQDIYKEKERIQEYYDPNYEGEQLRKEVAILDNKKMFNQLKNDEYLGILIVNIETRLEFEIKKRERESQ